MRIREHARAGLECKEGKQKTSHGMHERSVARRIQNRDKKRQRVSKRDKFPLNDGDLLPLTSDWCLYNYVNADRAAGRLY